MIKREVRGQRSEASRRGMLMIEMMISLMISAMLLLAIGAAYTATSKAITVNEDFFTASQAARVSMNQMLSVLRRCDSCQPGGYDGITSVWTSSSMGVNYHDPGTTTNHTCTYKFTNNQLQLITNNTTYSLANNVSAMTFTTDMAPDPQSQSGAKRPVRITIDMTLTVGKQNVRLTASAVPRNTVLYQ
jgi:Tfp pilus assembly protein PilW